MDARRCIAQEIETLVAHLRTDRNARECSMLIEDGVLTPWCATVAGRDSFGALSTLFEGLGTGVGARVAMQLTGRPRFLVREARRFWRESMGDEAMFQKLEGYLQDTRGDGLWNRTITLLDDASGLRIRDGNKRAIAIYEASEGAEIEVPVFILRPRVV